MTIPRNWQWAFGGFVSVYLELLDNRKQQSCFPLYLQGLLASL